MPTPKKPFVIPSLPKEVTRYRKISESSAYIPYIYLSSNPEWKKSLIIVDEHQPSSAEE